MTDLSAFRFPSLGARLGVASFLLVASLLGGCTTLPSSGPTARQVIHAERDEAAKIGIHYVDVGTTTIDNQSSDTNSAETAALADLTADGRVDALGPGDVLQIEIFETGAPLFSGGQTSMGALAASSTGVDNFDPSARRAPLPGITIDEDGEISLPYVGKLKAAGLKPAELGNLIEHRLTGLSQSPQVVVSVRDNIANTAIVMGEVHHPGRVPLTGAREHLLDAIATAGGAALAPEDLFVRFTRGKRSVEAPLTAIASATPADLTLLPGDRIQIFKRERSYTVFGATTKVSQQPFQSAKVSLAEAVARVGGPNDQLADPTAIFVFRYEPGRDPASHETPTIYRFNLLKPSQYFIAQRFDMRDKDVIYIANSEANQPSKIVQIIDQVFTPLFLAHQSGL